MATYNDVYLPRSRPSATTRGVNKPNRFRLFCYFVSLCIFSLFIVLSLVTITMNIQGREALNGNVPTIEIHKITVSNLNLSSPITAHWNINMSMHSTRSSFEFSNSRMSIFHKSKEEALWMLSLRKFDMRPKNSTFHFALDFWGSSAQVDDTTVRSIRENIMKKLGPVKFIVQFKAEKPRTIRLKYPIEKLWFDSRINRLVINCDVSLLFGSLTHAHMLKTDSHHCIVVTHGWH